MTVSRTGVHACSGIAGIAADTGVFLVNTSETGAPAGRQARTTARVPEAASPRTTMLPLTPAARAVAIAWATILPAPLPEPLRPARSRIPAITGAHRSVLIVAANGESP